MQKELDWLASFPKELERCRGKHIALIGEKIVASGKSAKGVFVKAKKKYPNKTPVLTFVPKKETLIL